MLISLIQIIQAMEAEQWEQAANRGGVILAVINTPTYAPVWDALNPNQYYNNFYGVGNITNPLENMARAKNNKDKENRLLASGNILLTPFPELKFKSTLTLDRRNAVNTTFLDPISTAWGRNQYGEGFGQSEYEHSFDI